MMALADDIANLLAIDPSARAVETDGRWTDWATMASMVRGIQQQLQANDLAPGTPVGLVLRNRAAHVAAMLALVSAGFCIVTLNPLQPLGRLANELSELRLSVVIADPEDWQAGELMAAAEQTGALAIAIDAAADNKVRIVVPAHPGDKTFHPLMPRVAVSMLTSGTTGAPKRVPLTFESLEQSIAGALHYEQRTGKLTELKTAVAVVATPLVHIGGLWTTLFSLLAGRPTVIFAKFSVAEFRRIMVAYAPKSIGLAPSALQMILKDNVPVKEIASLKAIIAGTAPLDPDFQEKFETHYQVPILVTYGATEFAGGVAGWTIADHRLYARSKRGSVGRAHPGCQLRVVDPDTGSEIGPEVEGLLEIKAQQVGGGRHWTRTTDLARLDADGFLYILGRADDVIIRGGFKVFPGDIAKVLRMHPDVRDAAATGLPDERLGAIPVAAVEVSAEATVTEDELRAFAREHLLPYQVPVSVKVVTELPRTPSLKVSQPELRALFALSPN